MQLTKLFLGFIHNKKTAGMLLVFCTVFSLLVANSPLGETYAHLWHTEVFSRTLEFWINDGLMTVFFLLVGLEIERELYIGELSGAKKAMLPVMAAVGGMLVPALIHFFFNQGTATQNGFGIPMATDIAFSLAILSLLGSRVPGSLKVFLTALAIIDDLGAIVIIALFYSKGISWLYLGLAAFLFAVMLVLNRAKMYRVGVYLVLGTFLWFFMYRSGVHATITGVLLAFAIPFGNGDEKSPSYGLQHHLHKPVAFFVLPLFALANTAIPLPGSFVSTLTTPNSLGIMLGLFLGKPVGIFLFSMLSVASGLCFLPTDIRRRDLLGAGLLGGIGFTMSMFITFLAFTEPEVTDGSKIAIILASILAGLTGFVYLHLSLTTKRQNTTSQQAMVTTLASKPAETSAQMK
jgi:Na+:H+ antiporter, NhaA family